jgi:hypothetical protein
MNIHIYNLLIKDEYLISQALNCEKRLTDRTHKQKSEKAIHRQLKH